MIEELYQSFPNVRCKFPSLNDRLKTDIAGFCSSCKEMTFWERRMHAQTKGEMGLYWYDFFCVLCGCKTAEKVPENKKSLKYDRKWERG